MVVVGQAISLYPVSGVIPDRSNHHTGHIDSLHPKAFRPGAQVRYAFYNVDISVHNGGRLSFHPLPQGGRGVGRERSWHGVGEEREPEREGD